MAVGHALSVISVLGWHLTKSGPYLFRSSTISLLLSKNEFWLVRAPEGPSRGSIGKAKGPEEAAMGLVEGHRTSSPLRIGSTGPEGELC